MQGFIDRIRDDHGDAYVAVVIAACQYYNMLAHNNGVSDPYYASTLETQTRQAWQLDGMVTAAAAVLNAEPHTLEREQAKRQAQDDIRMMAAVMMSGTQGEG